METAAEKQTAFYSLNPADRDFEEFLETLRRHEIRVLVDVRANPDDDPRENYRKDWLRGGLMGAGLTYHWAGRQLGEKQTPLANSRNVALPEQELRAFADHMETDVFRKGLDGLINVSGTENTAIFYGQADYRASHCRLIADALHARGRLVRHILPDGELEEHRADVRARPVDGVLVYDQAQES